LLAVTKLLLAITKLTEEFEALAFARLIVELAEDCADDMPAAAEEEKEEERLDRDAEKVEEADARPGVQLLGSVGTWGTGFGKAARF
jgi:hypothetical protein